jgi:hypothetical protein
VNVAEVDGRWDYAFSAASKVFSVVPLEMDEEMERQVQGWGC